MSPKLTRGPLLPTPPEASAAALPWAPQVSARHEWYALRWPLLSWSLLAWARRLVCLSGIRSVVGGAASVTPALHTRWRPGAGVLAGVLLVLLLVVPGASPAWAGLDDDRYDGNIFALYAGNGSLVPPRSTLAEARADGRVAVVIYYLDDSSVSKRFAPVVSELQRQWGNSIELIPLVTDPLQDRKAEGADDPASYWKGTIPQVVVFDRAGKVVFDASGSVSSDAINSAVSRATGIPLPAGANALTTESFNELNAEVVPVRP